MTTSDYTSKPAFLQRNFHWLFFFLIFAAAAALRVWGFFLPSNIGDPTGYQSLAMKMNHGYMKHYDIFHYRMEERPGQGLVDYVWEEDPQQWNSRRLRGIYHLPLHLQPPLYPTVLWLSHGVFNHGQVYTSVSQNRGWGVTREPPWHYFNAQFYAVFPGFAASLGLIVAVYLFCLHFYSYREGLLASLLLACSTLDIAISAKVYADGVLSLLTFLSLFSYFLGIKKSGNIKYLYAIAAGLFLGLAYLTKVTGILFGAGLLIATLLSPQLNGGLFRRLFYPPLWIAAGLALLTASPWLLLMHQVYGKFLVNTPQDPKNPWYQYVFARPAYAYPTGIFYFMPASLLGFIRGIIALLKPRACFLEVTLFLTALLYLGSFVFFKYSGTAGVEDRYLIPLYPLLAILAARLVSTLAKACTLTWLRQSVWGLGTLLFLGLGVRSAWLGLKASMANLVIFKPFGF